MGSEKPYRYYVGDCYYFVTEKQYKACYYHEHTFRGEIMFLEGEVILSFDNSIIAISDGDEIHISWKDNDSGWMSFKDTQLEMANIQPIIDIIEGVE